MNGTWVDRYKPALLVAWLVLIATYMHLKVPVLLEVDWSHDDLMNCYRVLTKPWGDIVWDIACFWKPTDLFRPLGELFYKVMWTWFGFDPLPWRLVIGALLMGNAFIVGHLATRLTGSLPVGLAAVALASYHPMWSHLYMNTGTVFEILAFTLVYGGLVWYTEFHDPWGTAVLLILGLNAKESAIVLAPLVVIYEWIWRRRTPWLFCGLAGAICLAFIFGRVYGPSGLTSIGGYVPTYSVGQYLKSFQAFLGPLVLWPAAPILVWLLPLGLRNKLASFAVVLFPVAILPLAFVADRGLEGIYIACAALPLVLSAALLLLKTEPQRLYGAVALFAALAIWLPPIYLPADWNKEALEIRAFRDSLPRSLPPKAQIRMLSEPFSADVPWASTFIARLLYKDPEVVVVSPVNPHTKDKPSDNDFAVFEWKNGALQRIK